MSESNTVQPAVQLSQIEQLATNLIPFYAENPTPDADKLKKLEEVKTGWNIGVREDQKVTTEQMEKAKAILGLI